MKTRNLLGIGILSGSLVFASCGGGEAARPTIELTPTAKQTVVSTAIRTTATPTPTHGPPTASGGTSGGPSGSPTPVGSGAQRATTEGLTFSDKAGSLASSYQAFSTLDPKSVTDATRLSSILGALQRDFQAYQASINTIADVVSKIQPTASSQRTSSVPSSPSLGPVGWIIDHLYPPTTVYAQGAPPALGPPQMLALNDLLNQGIAGAGNCKKLYDEMAKLPLASTAWADKKAEADSCYAALQIELTRRGVKVVVQTGAGFGAAGATTLILGGAAVTVGGVAVPAGLVVLGVGLTARTVVGWIWDYCTAPDSSGGGLRAPLLQTSDSCAFVSGKGEMGQSMALPASGTGNLTIFIEGHAPVVLSGVTMHSGQVTTVSVNIGPTSPTPPQPPVAKLAGNIFLGASPYQKEAEMTHGLYVISAVDGKSRLVSPRAIDGVAISPDGTKLAAGFLQETGKGPGDPQLVIFDAKDSAYKSLRSIFEMRPGKGPDQLTNPSWAKDNLTLAVSRTGDLHLYAYSPDKSKDKTTFWAVWDGSYPAWSPTDNRLVIVGTSGDGLYLLDDVMKGAYQFDPKYEIWSQQASQGFRSLRPGAVTKIAGAPGNARKPKWSPDGKNVLFISDGALWAIPPTGGSPTRVSPEGWKIGAAAYSPDGNHIAVVRAEAPTNGGVWVVKANGSDPRQLAKADFSQYGRVDLAWGP